MANDNYEAEQRQTWLAALEREREGYVRAGDKQAVAGVDEQIALLKRSASQRAATGDESSAPKGRRSKPSETA